VQSGKRSKVRTKRKKVCPFKSGHIKRIDYKDVMTLRKFMTDNGKILPARVTGVSAKYQRLLTQAIKQARAIALLPNRVM
jgi:small subunit ribosomal protein S18